MKKPSPTKLSLLTRLENIEGQLKIAAQQTTFIFEALEKIEVVQRTKLQYVIARLEDAQAERDRRWFSRIKAWIKLQKEKFE